MYQCDYSAIATYKQFLAAKSRCKNLISARYSIPLAIWRHILVRFFFIDGNITCSKVTIIILASTPPHSGV